jgi:VanZ family protein
LALKIIYLGSAICWTLLIAFLCLGSFSNLPSLGIGGADKYIHITFHFGFTILWFLFFFEAKIDTRNPILKVFVSSILYGILIEIAQEFFTTTRKADLYDVLANTAGAIIAILLIHAFVAWQKRKYN